MKEIEIESGYQDNLLKEITNKQKNEMGINLRKQNHISYIALSNSNEESRIEKIRCEP